MAATEEPANAGAAEAAAPPSRVEKFAAAFRAATVNEERGRLLETALDGATVEEFLQIHVEALRTTASRVADLEARLAEATARGDALARRVSLQTALLQNFQCH